MSNRHRIGAVAALVMCAAFAATVTFVAVSDGLFLGPHMSPEGVILRPIRLPHAGYFEEFVIEGGSGKVADRGLEVRKIRFGPGSEITESERNFLSAYVEWNTSGYGRPIGLFVFFLLSAYLLSYLLARFGGPRARTLGPQIALFVALVLVLGGAKAYLVLTTWSEFFLPAVALSVFAALHLEKRLAFQVAICVALMLAALTGFDFQVLLVFLVQAVVVVAVIAGPKLFQVLWASLLGGLASGLMFVVSSLMLSGRVAFNFGDPYGDLYGSLAGSVIGGLLAYLAVAPLERVFGTASRARLAEIAEFNHPLLKELRERAPGTWQHSIAMANLAEEAADAIGANGFLCRVAAYYHDIGKMLNPRFFTENQRDGENPHDKIAPQESAEIIINHVVDGARLAAKHKLPRIVADFIPQHHGSSLIAYFYDKALEGNGGKNVDRSDFSYKGNRPNSRETGIMMIVDAVEAASRALKKVTPKTVERMVQHIVFSKLLYGQLDESELTVPQLKTISLTLVDAIMHARHERVQYPWQKEEEAAKKAAAESAPAQAASGAVPTPEGSGRVAVPASAPMQTPAPAPAPAPSGAAPVTDGSSGGVAGRISYPKNGAPSDEASGPAEEAPAEPEAASGGR